MNWLHFTGGNVRLVAACCLLFIFNSRGFSQKITGPLIIEPGVAEGFTLFAPLNSKTTYLIDNCGRVINTWQSDFMPGNTAYLLPNGNLLRTIKLPNTVITGGGGGGGVELFDWESNLIWSFELNDDKLRLHHDVAHLPNGNILMVVWELRDEAEALAVGRDPSLIPSEGVIWSEQIIEVKPIPPGSSEIVWKWSAWDHLIQDFDNNKPGFDVVSDHPELVDINHLEQTQSDWIHANAIDYNEELDQIMLSSPFFHEFWIIDHSTTTAESASHLGGKSNKGGDLLYRWGNPLTYKSGTLSDQKLFGQHNVHWIRDGGERTGQVILFNNNKGSKHSSVEIVDLPLNSNSTYDLSGNTFGPSEPNLVFTSDPEEQFHSRIMGGAEVLPNGNLFICSSLQGIIFEVTPDNETVWHYKSPVTIDGIVGREVITEDPNYVSDNNFRAIKYNYDYAAFNNRDLTPQEPIEGEPWASCDLVTGVEEDLLQSVSIYPNPVRDVLHVKSISTQKRISANLMTMYGQTIYSKMGDGTVTFDMRNLNAGFFILSVNNKTFKILKTD